MDALRGHLAVAAEQGLCQRWGAVLDFYPQVDTLIYVQVEGCYGEPSSSPTRHSVLARRYLRTLGMLVAVALGALSVVVSSALPAFGAPIAGTTPGAASTASVQPMSASGCNQSVCITGSGTEVTNWSTSATLPASMCSVADYWAAGNLVYQGNEKCGAGNGSVFSYWPKPGYFAPGTQLCSTWTGVAGRPCETVE